MWWDVIVNFDNHRSLHCPSRPSNNKNIIIINCEDHSLLDFTSAVQYMKYFVYNFTLLLLLLAKKIFVGEPFLMVFYYVIPQKKHCVLKAVHPSPLSAHRGFLGCKHFSQANDYLKKVGKKAVNWCSLPLDENEAFST